MDNLTTYHIDILIPYTNRLVSPQLFSFIKLKFWNFNYNLKKKSKWKWMNHNATLPGTYIDMRGVMSQQGCQAQLMEATVTAAVHMWKEAGCFPRNPTSRRISWLSNAGSFVRLCTSYIKTHLQVKYKHQAASLKTGLWSLASNQDEREKLPQVWMFDALNNLKGRS